jgi:hypothetical protein
MLPRAWLSIPRFRRVRENLEDQRRLKRILLETGASSEEIERSRSPLTHLLLVTAAALEELEVVTHANERSQVAE